jgi:2,3-dimethylmalate lyase
VTSAARGGRRAAVFDRLAAGPVLAPGAWDPLSALVAAEAGFDVLFLSGYAVAGSYLGRPDVGLLTQTEVADVARRTVAALGGRAELLVDADTGYGNPLNTIRTVQLWEQAGAAGLFLEDQVWPKRCGHMSGKAVVARGDWLAKVRAALDARTDLFVCARTDARAPLGLGEALDRGRAAADLGVDAVFVEAPQSIAEMEAIAAALPGVVLVANMVEAGRTPLLTPAELGELGFGLVVSPVTGVFAATAALRAAFGTLARAGTMRDDLDRLVSFDEFTDLVGLPAVHDEERRYPTS